MACPPNQIGSIMSELREMLNKGKISYGKVSKI
jgi:hypothetical protein